MAYEAIKQEAAGKCVLLITTLTPIGEEITTCKEDITCPQCKRNRLHPCRKFGDVNDHGRVRCHECFPLGTSDIIDTVKSFGGYATQGEAARAVATRLGLGLHESFGHKPITNIIEAVAKAKAMPLEAFKQFGVTEAKHGRKKEIVARVNVYDAKGQTHSHCDISTVSKDARLRKGKFKPGKGNSGLFLPGRLPKPGEMWCLVEGVKDAAALVGLDYNACGLPGAYMADKYAPLFKGVHVVTVADLDNAGRDGAQKTGGNLAGIAATVKAARLPGEIVDSGGDDVRDVIKKRGEQAVHDAIANAADWQPRESDPAENGQRPEEVVTLHYAWHVDRVIGHLGRLGWETPWIPEAKRDARRIYQRGGLLVDVVTETKPDATAKGGRVKISKGTPRIRPLPNGQLKLRIADAVQLVKVKESDGDSEKVPIPPPSWLTDGVLTAGDYGEHVRHLDAIVTAPTIRPDGSVLQEPGWDASGLLYRPTMKFEPIPDKPTRDDARAAAATLFGVVADFPFVDEKVDPSAWVAMLLSMIGRPCVTGQVPLFPIMANTRGAGKSLLVDVASIIAFGHTAARTPYTADDDEMRKRITSLIMEGSPAVLLDNINRPIGGASLDAVLTAERWKDRELGASRTIDLPARVVWMATGNNLRFRSDIARRVLPIRLLSKQERPEERSDFKHPDLLGWTRKLRGELVTAALTILRGYFVAGCPKQTGGQFGSFEAWSEIIRGAIVWAGCADPMETIETAQADDDSAAIVAGLAAGLLEVDPTGDGITCREIIDKLSNPDNAGSYPAMRDVVAEVGMSKGKPDARRLGYAIRDCRDRVCTIDMSDNPKESSKVSFQIVGDPGHAKRMKWKAKPVSDGGDGGYGGHVFGSTTRENGCVTSQGTQHDQHAVGPKVSPSSPPSPPRPREPACPKCSGAMEPNPAEPGWTNWDCLTPGCDGVKAMKSQEATA